MESPTTRLGPQPKRGCSTAETAAGAVAEARAPCGPFPASAALEAGGTRALRPRDRGHPDVPRPGPCGTGPGARIERAWDPRAWADADADTQKALLSDTE